VDEFTMVVVPILVTLFFVGFLAYGLMVRRSRQSSSTTESRTSGSSSSSFTSSSLTAYQRKKTLTRLKPILIRIQQRLETHLSDKQKKNKRTRRTRRSASFCGVRFLHDSGKIQYSPIRLFECLDANHDGYLRYDEL